MFRVLYVDDEPALLNIGKLFLERSGSLSVDTASSAKEALGRLQDLPYDCVISGYQMPVMDGIGLLQQIREGYQDLPFILLTGRGREEIAIDAVNNGADFSIQKGGDPESRFIELEHAVKDVINRKQAREKLEESRQRMADLINFLPCATFAIDLDHRVIVWNRAMEEISGLKRESVLGTADYSYAVPFYGIRKKVLIDYILDKDETLDQNYPHLVRQGDQLISEIYSPNLYSGRGGHIWFIASPLYNSKGEVVGAIESIRDITDRVRAEKDSLRSNEELRAAYEQMKAIEGALRINFEDLNQTQQKLRESEERYRTIVEDQTEFICRFTPDGKLTFVNDAYCRYFGLDKAGCIGSLHKVRIHPDDVPLLKQHFASFSRENPVAIIEHRIIMPSGEIRWQRWSDRAIFDPSGRIIEYQSVGRDTTEPKRTERALYEANKKLNLLSSITRHDILNELTVLQGALGLIEITNEHEEERRWMEKAVRASKAIRSKISFTQQYQDIGVQEPRWHNVFKSALTVCMDGGFSKVSLDKRLEGVEIFADPLLRMVFANLFDNAIRHGGNVSQIQVSGAAVPEGYVITVEDDGDGIPPEDKKRIFQKGVGKNTGYGLFLVTEVLAITGLTIRENGEFGTGARFEIHIPKDMFRFTGR